MTEIEPWKELRFTVPLLPPSVNHYKKPRKGGGYYVTAEAQTFIDAVCIFSRKQPVEGKFYEIEVWYYLPPIFRGDADNFVKVTFDALAVAGVIRNDAFVVDHHVHKRRVLDMRNSRTEIIVRGLERCP